jgi:hypothetical protein
MGIGKPGRPCVGVLSDRVIEFPRTTVTMGDMRACAGAWVTPQALTACIGNSNVPGKDMPPLAEAEACAAIPSFPLCSCGLKRRFQSKTRPGADPGADPAGPGTPGTGLLMRACEDQVERPRKKFEKFH